MELELQRLHLVTLTEPDGTVEQATPPTALATQVLGATAGQGAATDHRDHSRLTA